MMSDSEAYLLGAILGDGNLCKSHGDYQVRLEVTSPGFLAAWNAAITKVTGKTPFISKPRWRENSTRPLLGSRMNSKAWFLRFEALREQFMKSELPLTSSASRQLIKGFYDSEGSFDAKNGIRFTNANIPLLLKVRELLLKQGIHSRGPWKSTRLYHLCVKKKLDVNAFREIIGMKA